MGQTKDVVERVIEVWSAHDRDAWLALAELDVEMGGAGFPSARGLEEAPIQGRCARSTVRRFRPPGDRSPYTP